VSLPDVVSMDAGKQRPVLETMNVAYPHMYLVSTTDYDGINVARSDGADPKDYSDRDWVNGAKGGELTFQVLVGRTSGEPALVASLPIKGTNDAILGVGMFASDLDKVAQAVKLTQVGESGLAYVVDEFNQVVVHPDSEYAATLQDMSAEPAVKALRNGSRGAVLFVDADGNRWRAHVDELDNGWGVIVQQPESELLGAVGGLPPISWLVIVLGVLILAALTTLTVRQSIRPIDSLTATATAIAAGDLERDAPVESEDELGSLARSFNSMTRQLRELIGGLEEQVVDRTQALAQRTSYLEATAEVGRVAASILDTGELIEQAVELIRDRFGLYYVGLFLVDEAGEWAVLQAGTGEAGQAMLERGHRIQVGEGMIGWSVAHSQPRIAAEAGADAVRLATPELPETRSEAALPLRSRGQVLGALTVQHVEAGAFDEATITVLQTMADQVALALNNAQLFDDSQQALEATRLAYGEMSRQAWASQGRSRGDWGYRYAQRTIVQAEGAQSADMAEAQQTGRTRQGENASLAVPVKVREQVVGVLGFRKGESGEVWTASEIDLLETFAEQLAIALESARLHEETQNRAAREQMVGQITARMRETLDVDAVLQAAVREIGDVLRLHDIQIQLEMDGESALGSTASPARREVS
jgi:GAF domain-containing protein/HAMP domain-containing protein